MRYLTVNDSEIIESVGYDSHAEDKQLHVIFKATPDTVYQYDCEPAEFVRFVSSESIGKMFHERFKKAKFTKSQRQPTLKK